MAQGASLPLSHAQALARGHLTGYLKAVLILREGLSADTLRHNIRLARSWRRLEGEHARAGGLGFSAAQTLATLDSMGRSALRRRLVEAYIRGETDRSELFRRVRTAKAARTGRLKPGPRLRALLDLRRTLASRLNRVRARLQSALMLWPAAQRPEVRRLSAQLRRIQAALEQRYLDAASELRAR